MREVAEKLERNAQEVQYGSVSVELRIHAGKVVKTIYTSSVTDVRRNKNQKEDQDE